MKAALWLILLGSLCGLGYGLWEWLSGSGNLYETLIQIDTTIRVRFWHMVSWWPLLAWAVVVAACEGVDYRSSHLFGGFQRGLMRLSVPLVAAVAGFIAVGLVRPVWPGPVFECVLVALIGLASFTLVAGRPTLR